jgi:hypothetical protein
VNGVLIAIAVFAGIFFLRWVVSMITGGVEIGIELAGDRLGEGLASGRSVKAPASSLPSEWVVNLTKPVAEVRTELVAAGLADDSDRVRTSSGLLVELYEVPDSSGLACSWDPTAGQKPTAIIADVLRIVRQIDPEAQVIL